MLKFPRLAALLVASALATPLAAQPSERDDAHLRNDCRLASQVLRTGHPAPRREWALDAIRRCDESGPAALADAWRTATLADENALGLLFNASRDFNDRRIVDAVADVARRRSAGGNTRIYAFALLFNYAVPGRYITVEDLLNPREGVPPGMSGVSHDDRADDTRALLGDLRPEVSAILQSVVEGEPNSRVAGAAATVLRRLRNF